MKQEIYVVIMAGGIGSRFWPRSREKNPKQLLEIVGNGTMLQNTIQRLENFVEQKNIFIVTNKLLKQAISKQVPKIPCENILVEPLGRNTAPCIGLAALFIERLNPQGVMVVLPADHLITDEEKFLSILTKGVETAKKHSALVTIGIQPTRPETGYGYIQIEEEATPKELQKNGIYRVKTFAEKPNNTTAQQFLESGDFLWNSGMFIWRADVILHEIQKSLPELHQQLLTLKPAIGTTLFEQSLEKAYGLLRGISIDYGVMEKAENVYVVKSEFGWNDVGSWDEVMRISPKDEQGNFLKGKTITHNTKNTYIHAEHKLVATVGMENVIIIDTPDATLICKKGDSQDVKEIVDALRRKQMTEYL